MNDRALLQSEVRGRLAVLQLTMATRIWSLNGHIDSVVGGLSLIPADALSKTLVIKRRRVAVAYIIVELALAVEHERRSLRHSTMRLLLRALVS